MISTWNFGVCDICLNNSHEEIKMIREKIFYSGGNSVEMWVCPQCGSSKRL